MSVLSQLTVQGSSHVVAVTTHLKAPPSSPITHHHDLHHSTVVLADPSHAVKAFETLVTNGGFEDSIKTFFLLFFWLGYDQSMPG
jgi:hypothetical protein